MTTFIQKDGRATSAATGIPDFNSVSVRADTITSKTHTEAEVQAMIAAAVMEAAALVRPAQRGEPIPENWRFADEVLESRYLSVLTLIRPDARAALDRMLADAAMTARSKALREAADVVDCDGCRGKCLDPANCFHKEAEEIRAMIKETPK
jgi:hypothetical protein